MDSNANAPETILVTLVSVVVGEATLAGATRSEVEAAAVVATSSEPDLKSSARDTLTLAPLSTTLGTSPSQALHQYTSSPAVL